MDLGIAGRRALVCGASRGLGYGCARALANEGVAVTLVARGMDNLEKAASSLEKELGRAPAFVAADISTEEGRSAVLAACPSPDILVTNAGGPPAADFRQLSHMQWRGAVELNFLSAVELIRATVDAMLERNFGRIINVTSMTVRSPIQGLDLSNATRMALTGYVAGVARQIAPGKVTINNLLPGTFATERVQALGETVERLIAKVPAGRAGTTEEFGAACAFLCSVQAGYITGQNLLLDGGLCSFTV